MSTKLTIGDVVCLKSGGQPFTITGYGAQPFSLRITAMSAGGKCEQVDVAVDALYKYSGPLTPSSRAHHY